MKKCKFLASIAFLAIMVGVYPSQSNLAAESETVQGSTAESRVLESNSGNIKSNIKENNQLLPKIIGAKDKTIKINQKFNPKESITAFDPKDGDLTDKIQISGIVDTSKTGKYKLTYSVVNSQGEKALQKITIDVQADESPKYRVEITDFSLPLKSNFSKEIQKRVVIKDNYNKTIENKGIKVSVEENTQYNELGILPVNFLVNMVDGTILEGKVNITIYSGIRIVEPRVGYTHTGSIYEDAIDFMKYIEAYEIDGQGNEKRLGAYDADTKFGIKIVKSDLDVSVAGKYAIVYQVINSLGEIVNHTSYVTVVKEKKEDVPPMIQAEDHVLYVGDVLTKEIVLGWTKTTDADKLIFEVVDDQIPTTQVTNRLTKAGEYKIRYMASRMEEESQSELTAEKVITLIVKEKETTSNTQKKLPNSNANNAKKTIPTSATQAKTLPKTGSEKANFNLIFVGAVMVSIVFIYVIKRKRMIE
ncbi:DUF5011 domain-containing protein [Enterococcus raffinosus]|uniref:immunoglobulin-like domain-containing protein n=1 Tax=Enterococcus raffinosus TaxID=71452 RepID=UPI001C0FBED5|nr:immunoglobulin-like domain-containing protein [Enterococcus raffinosus]MBU5359617.1 DUF5011 domain-containing protein [Enterococcus raffinosus]